MTRQTRMLVLAGIVALCTVVAVAYVLRARRAVDTRNAQVSGVVDDAVSLTSAVAGPHALFRTLRQGQGYGHVVVVPLAAPDGPRYQTPLLCERLDMAAGVGVCLSADRGVVTEYWATIFDSTFQTRHRLALSGIPSRARMSPDGRLAGMTVFVSGHSYSQGAFSTHTTIVDTATGQIVTDLESFEILLDGAPFKKVDFNFWGVTFTNDSNTFYATLGTGNDLHLIRADVRARRGVVVRQGIECPAISPDNRHLAFKKRTTVDGRMVWRVATLNLESGEERLVAGETRHVDDQVQWLDNGRLFYSVADDAEGITGTSVRVVEVTGSAPSSLWADGAYSPAVVTRP